MYRKSCGFIDSRCLEPWQVWKFQIDDFQKNFNVVVPALDAHVSDEPSEFVSIQDEAVKIVDWLVQNQLTDVYAVCGLSMGGAIAHLIACDERLEIKYLVLDGAPLVPSPRLLIVGMQWQYLSLMHQLKKRKRNAMRGFEKNFLPLQLLPFFLKFADTMDDTSVCNIVKSVGSSILSKSHKLRSCKILYLYGTKINEYLSKKSANLISLEIPMAKVMCFDGYSHAELAIYHPNKWMKIVKDFIQK